MERRTPSSSTQVKLNYKTLNVNLINIMSGLMGQVFTLVNGLLQQRKSNYIKKKK